MIVKRINFSGRRKAFLRKRLTSRDNQHIIFHNHFAAKSLQI